MCIECDAILRAGIADVFQYSSQSIDRESVRTWFFSDDFEKSIKNNSAGLSVTVPLSGVPLTFGGTADSAEAWEKRRQHSSSGAWDFTRLDWESVFRMSLRADIADRWLAAYQVRHGAINRIELTTRVTEAAINLTVRFKYTTGAPIPRITRIDAIGANASAISPPVTGEPMRDQEDFTIPWTGDSEDATVIVTTSVGTSSTVVARPAAGLMMLSYRVPVEVWTSSAARTAGPVTTDNRHNEKADGRQPTSPDGKWWASDRTLDISVGPDERIVTAEARHVGGPGTHHSVSVTYENSRTRAHMHLRSWTHPVSYLLVAQVEKKQIVHELRQDPPAPFQGGRVTVRVPVNAIGGRFMVTLSRGRYRECDVGATVLGLALQKKTSLSAYTEYEYAVVP